MRKPTISYLKPIEDYFQSEFQGMTVQQVVDYLERCRGADGAIEFEGNVIDIEVSQDGKTVSVASILHGSKIELADEAYHRTYTETDLREVVQALLSARRP